MKKIVKSIPILLLSITIAKSQTQNVIHQDQNSFISFIKTIDKKGIEIPKQYYPILKIDTSEIVPSSPFYSLMEVKQSNKCDVLGIFNIRHCGVIICFWDIRLYSIKSGQIIGNQLFDLTFQGTPEITFIHEVFLILSEKVINFEEIGESMVESGEPYINRVIITILDDKIEELSKLSKEDLRIYRNHIFARYGRKFKSEDLQKYFGNFEWYSPVYDNVDDRLTPIDKEIINTINSFEKK